MLKIVRYVLYVYLDLSTKPSVYYFQKGVSLLPRNHPRTRITSTVSTPLSDKLSIISDVIDLPKSELIDEALELLVQKYKDRVITSGSKGASIFMAKTLAFCSHKGGVGKTTSTACFADLLSKRGYHVLLIDTDSQGNLSKRFGYPPQQHFEKTLTQLVDDILSDEPHPVTDFVCATQNKSIDIIPCDDRYAEGVKHMLSAVMLGINAYKLIVHELSTCYDFIIFDTKPAVDDDVKQVMLATQWVMIPTDAADDSIDGARNTLKFIKAIRRGNPDLAVAGAFFNAVNMRTSVAHDYVPQIREAWGPLMFEPIIPYSQDAKKAEGYHAPVSEKYPNGKITRNFSKLVEEVLNRIG